MFSKGGKQPQCSRYSSYQSKPREWKESEGNKANDIWSIGVITYELYTKQAYKTKFNLESDKKLSKI